MAQSGGPKITINNFKLGAGYGYSPSVSATGLVGTILYSGSPFNYTVNAENEVVYTLYLDETVGDFNFGEIGLYLEDGTLFAVGAYNSPQLKLKTTGSQVGNQIVIEAKLKLSNLAPVINFNIQQIALARILQVNGIHLLVPPILAGSNAYLTGSYDDETNIIYAFRHGDYRWSFPTHQLPIVVGQVTDLGSSDPEVNSGNKVISVNIGSLINDVVSGRYIIHFISGNQRGLARIVQSSGTNYVTWGEPTGAIPQLGSNFVIYKSNASVLGQLNSTSATEDDIIKYSVALG